jgi:catechol 2,3-dioxygenase-like lactoylglutathione lyase family enzyme
MRAGLRGGEAELPIVVGLDHVQLAMPAGKESLARPFYAGLLGLTEVEKPPHLAARGGAWFESAGVRIHLGVDHDFRPARKAHPGLLVTNLKGLAGSLRAAGYDVAPGEPLEGYEHAYVDDPFGNRLELMELT